MERTPTIDFFNATTAAYLDHIEFVVREESVAACLTSQNYFYTVSSVRLAEWHITPQSDEVEEFWFSPALGGSARLRTRVC